MKKMFSRVLAGLLVLMIAFGNFSNAYAESVNLYYENYCFFTVTNGNASIVLYMWNGTNFSVPSYLNGYPVTKIGDYAFSDTELRYVSIPDTVLDIGANAFKGCYFLSTVKMSAQTNSIGANAFDGCHNLVNITIPSKIRLIGEYAFNDCESIKSVNLPETIVNIGFGAFNYCENLTEITIGDQNTMYSTKDGSLLDKSGKTLLQAPLGREGVYNLPTTTEIISGHAFAGSRTMTGVVFPDSLTEIGQYTFLECISLKSINIPYNVNNISTYAFLRCSKLTEFLFPAGPNGETNKTYKSIDGVMYDVTGKTLYMYPPGREGTFRVPAGVETIGSASFKYANNLKRIVFPTTIKALGDESLRYAGSLKEIIFLGNAPAFGNDALLLNNNRKIFYMNGKKGFGETYAGYKIYELAGINITAENKYEITGITLPATHMKLVVGTSTSYLVANSSGKWTKKLKNKLPIGTKMVASMNFTKTEKASKTDYVRPLAPTVNPLISRSMLITGKTYPKGVITYYYDKHVVADSKGNFSIKLAAALQAGDSLYFKVYYKKQYSADTVMVVT